MFVKPKDGRSVPDPARGDLLPAGGRNVDESHYWHRRAAAGEIEIADDKKPSPAKTKKQGGDQ